MQMFLLLPYFMESNIIIQNFSGLIAQKIIEMFHGAMQPACAGLLEVKCHVEKSWSSYTQLGMGFTV